MAEVVYLLCAIAAVACAALLFRGYRASRTGLLFWAALCFAGLALNNVLLFVDLVVVENIDLSLVRSGTALAAMLVLMVGLTQEERT